MKKFKTIVGFVLIALTCLLLYTWYCGKGNIYEPSVPTPISSSISITQTRPDTAEILEDCLHDLIPNVNEEPNICKHSRVYGDGISDTMFIEDFKYNFNVEDYIIKRYSKDSLGFLIELTKVSGDTLTKSIDLCTNWEDLKEQAKTKVIQLQGCISDIAGDQYSYEEKTERISEAIQLFISDTVTIEIIPDKKSPEQRIKYRLKDYFEWLRAPRNKTTIKIEWTDEITVSDFSYDARTGTWKAEASFVQVYRKLISAVTVEGKGKVQTYFDITYKRIDIYLKKAQIPGGDGCVILLGNVYADKISE